MPKGKGRRMKTDEIAFIKNHIRKMKRVYKVFLALLTVFELMMTVRGFIFFNLEKKKLRLYLYSYIFLFLLSLSGLLLFIFCKDEKKTIISTYVYTFCFMLWAALITCIDVYTNGDSGMTVYVATCITLGILMLIKPIIFISYVCVSGACVILFTAMARNWQFFSSGFYINFAVFLAMATFINLQNYRLSEREYETRRKMKEFSYVDQLTRVFNRRSLAEKLASYQEQRRAFTFILLDVDNLKIINDTYGHSKGDDCLREIAEKLTEKFGKQVYRFGGDEFCVVTEEETSAIGKKLNEINAELNESRRDVDLHVSAGVYLAEGGENASQILIKADKALYRAKNSGKNKWEAYQEELSEGVLKTQTKKTTKGDKEKMEGNGCITEAMKHINSLLAVYDRETGTFTYHEDIVEYFKASPEGMLFWDFLVKKGITSQEDANQIKDIVLTLNEKNSVFFTVVSFGVMGRHILSFTYLANKVAVLVKLFDQGDLDNETIKYDELTRLISRKHFCADVEKINASHAQAQYAIFFFDIVKFKSINDIFGYGEGDKILKYIADTLRNGHLPIERACRVTADEFAFLADITNGDATDIANRLIAEIKKYKISFELVVNVGIYVIPKEEREGNAMLDKARLAQAAIKGHYSKQICFYDDDIRNAMISEQEIFAEMNVALEEGQFIVYYQPQYDHSTGMIVGAEALVRWQHTKKGMISPALFIPIFEKNGFITKLDFYVFDKVAAFIKRSLDNGHSVVPVSVNFSKHDIFANDFVENLEKIRQTHGVAAKYLRVEITESVLIGNNKAVNEIIDKLRAYGYVIEMDDFGAGYSSLNVLKDLDFDIIKLDMLFLQGEGKNSRGGTILSSVVNMAKWLHIPIIAEGVETVEQADFLKSIGCNYVQGYLYSKPLPENEYAKLIAGNAVGAIIPQMNIDEKLHTENFWNPSSQETLIFSNFVGAAVIFSYNRKAKTMEVLRVNKKYLQELGMNLSEQEFIRKDPLQTLDEENKRVYIATIEKAVETGEEQECETWRELRSPCCGVENFFVRSTMIVIGKSDDQVLFYCMIRNITNERKTLDSMLATEKKFKMASEQANMYFWEYTVATKEMRPCFRCMRDLGLPPLVRNYPEPAIEMGIFPPEVADMYRDWHVQVASGVKELEAIIPLTPERVPFRVKYTTEFDENGRPVKAYGSAVFVVE